MNKICIEVNSWFMADAAAVPTRFLVCQLQDHGTLKRFSNLKIFPGS